jgi:hypothetical protein
MFSIALDVQNVVVDCVIFLLCISEVSGSFFNLEIKHSKMKMFVVFQNICLISGLLPKIMSLKLCVMLFTVHYLLIILLFDAV